MKADGRFVTLRLRVRLEIVEEAAHVGRRRLLAGVPAGECQIRLKHPRHLVNVIAQRLNLRTVLDQRQLELEASEQGAQIVRHAGQHGGALLDGALDAPFHFNESLRGPSHFAGAARTKPGDFAALAEALGRIGQRQNRTDLIAQEQDRHREQHQRRAHHPQQENLRIGRVGSAATGEDPQDRVVKLDADLNQGGPPDRVDPEWPRDLFANLN